MRETENEREREWERERIRERDREKMIGDTAMKREEKVEKE